MANNITERISYLKDTLDEIVTREAVTTAMTANPKDIKQLDAKTFKLMSISTSGLGAYANGYKKGAITNTWQTITLEQDRGIRLDVEKTEELETGGLVQISRVASEFVRTEVVPEIDAYRLSKAVALCDVSMKETEELGASSIYTALVNGLNKIYDSFGVDHGCTVYLNMKFKSYLDLSTQVTHTVMVDQRTGAQFTVPTINGSTIVYVPSLRMKSAYDFYDGSTDFGFTSADDAVDVNFIIIAPGAVQAIVAINDLKIIGAENNPDGNADIFGCEILHDVFVPNNKKCGLFVSLDDPKNPHSYTITYDANSGSGTVTDSKSPYGENQRATVKASTGLTAPSSKEFDAWNTAANGSGTTYKPGQKITMTANVTLYAQWKDA